jgi:glycosyltransferase involved in cell wall biosynthesis
MTEKIFIVIPAFNEEAVIQDVIDETKKSGYENIIIIDDGSSDDTFQKAKERNVFALRHKINRGKGAAAKTGIEAAKLLGAEIAVTMDADGQHNPADIAKMVQLLEDGHDVVLGTRLQNPTGMPQYKIFANQIGNFFTWMIYGLWVTDSQSGFRAYSRRAMEQIDTRTDHYEYDSEVIREIRRNQLKHVEIPIEVRYTEYSMSKLQKQGFVNGLKTLYNMIWSIIS